MTTAEQRAKKMDVKHAMLAERATAARERCDKLCLEYAPWQPSRSQELQELNLQKVRQRKQYWPTGWLWIKRQKGLRKSMEKWEESHELTS